MSSKSWVLIGLTVGSLIGGYIPVLFGTSFLSLWSLTGNTIGGIVGIYITYKLLDL